MDESELIKTYNPDIIVTKTIYKWIIRNREVAAEPVSKYDFYCEYDTVTLLIKIGSWIADPIYKKPASFSDIPGAVQFCNEYLQAYMRL